MLARPVLGEFPVWVPILGELPTCLPTLSVGSGAGLGEIQAVGCPRSETGVESPGLKLSCSQMLPNAC